MSTQKRTRAHAVLVRITDVAFVCTLKARRPSSSKKVVTRLVRKGTQGVLKVCPCPVLLAVPLQTAQA